MKQATELTSQEHDDLVDFGNRFWEDFSEVCERYIDAAPPHLKAYYTMYLGEKTSIYGRKQK